MASKIAAYAQQPTPEWAKVKGKCVYASRLCKGGRFEEAKAYLEKFGIPFPPFSEDPVKTAQRLANTQVPAPAQIETPVVAADSVKAQESACGEVRSTGEVRVDAPSLSVGVAAPTGQQEAEAGTEPNVEKAPTEPSLCRAKIIGFCPNPRVVAIEIIDTQERASMWNGVRRFYRQNEVVEVELDRGIPGKNAIYREKLKAL